MTGPKYALSGTVSAADRTGLDFVAGFDSQIGTAPASAARKRGYPKLAPTKTYGDR